MPEIKLIQYFDDHFYKIELPIEVEIDGHTEIASEVKYFPSVTTKLSVVNKPFLASWRGDIGNREANLRIWESQLRGKRIHRAWEVYCNGGQLIYQPFAFENYTKEELAELTEKLHFIIQYQDEWLDAYKLVKWCEIVKPNIISNEMTVYSLTREEAGTVDNIMEIKEGAYMINGSKPLKLEEGNYLVDLKSGAGVYDEAYMQEAAYMKFYEEMGLGEIKGALTLHTQAKTKAGIKGLATILRTREQLESDFIDYTHVAEMWKRKNPNYKHIEFEFPTVFRRG